MKKKLLISIFIFICTPFILAEDYKTSFSLFINGGMSYIKEGFESRSFTVVETWPVSFWPAHYAPTYGVSFNIKLYKNVSLELGGNYKPGKHITVVSSESEFTYRTLDFYNTFLSLFFNFTSSKIMPYVLFGGGMKFTEGASGEWITPKYAYPVYLDEVAKKSSEFLHGGAGIKIYLKKGLALRIESVYIYLIEEKKDLIQFVGGLQLF